ncbi:MAG TPA: PDZ domain-containing protein [Burkholderiales bacterium]|nr:PDZ domain-containing protein [Burkholderiales bacterium]
MRRLALLVVIFLAACGPAPDGGLRLVTIDSADTGLSLRELPPQTLKSIGLPYGLAVVKTGALAQRAGLRVGDIVYGVNHRKVKSLQEFNRLLAQEGGGRFGLLVRRGRSDFYVGVDLAGPSDSVPKGMPSPRDARDTLLRT